MRRNYRELYSKEEIARRVGEVAKAIIREHCGDSVLMVCVLDGSVLFFSDLVRLLDGMDIEFGFISVSSYGGARQSSGLVRITDVSKCNPENKNVIVVEDIIDSGYTISEIRKYYTRKNAKKVQIACLLNKPSRRVVHADVDYSGFEMLSDAFVVGYGMDNNRKHRELDCIYKIED